MKTRKNVKWGLLAMMMAVSLNSSANDGVYYASGSHLIPLAETDIAIKKEVLTISIGDDGYASVDVQYEFQNKGNAKTVTMGFEAGCPYNDGEPFNAKGIHPYIKDFSATMNNQRLNYSNGVVKRQYDEEGDFTPLDLKVWREPRSTDPESERGEDHELYNPKTHEYTTYAYVYFFKANFKQGVNTIHHTYRYRMSNGVGRSFEIPYWLTPAMRWANSQIDDFTLIIKAENTTKHFVVDCSIMDYNNFRITSGKGKKRIVTGNFDEANMLEVVLRNGTLEWHGSNFKPTEDLNINSMDVMFERPVDSFLYYDSGPGFYFYFGEHDFFKKYGLDYKDEKAIKRLLRNLPYAHRGYVFKDALLKKIFSEQWWYMPDPSWTPTNNSFFPHEQQFIKDNQ